MPLRSRFPSRQLGAIGSKAVNIAKVGGRFPYRRGGTAARPRPGDPVNGYRPRVGGPDLPPPRNKVVATGPGGSKTNGTVTRPGNNPPKDKNAGKAPNTSPSTKGGATWGGKGGKPSGKGKPGGSKPSGGGKPKPTPKPTGIGFNPKKMAQTLTNLGYDADLAELQRQVDTARGSMGEALADLQGWANQIEEQHRVDSAATAAAFDQAVQQSEVNDANIAALFGGIAGGEAAAYSGAGEDMLGAIGASDKAFDARMYAILGAQAQDYMRRARGQFGQQIAELEGKRFGLQREKGQAYKKNLLELMDMAWGRQQDIRQAQIAEEALEQSRAMAGIELQKGQQSLVAGAQGIQQGKLQIQAQKLALKKSALELKKIAMGSPGGLNWSDPNTGAQLANAAFTGALSPRGTFMINPRVAWQNAQLLLGQYQAAGNPMAMAAIWNQFKVLLNLSHANKQWGQYQIVGNQLIYDPSRRFKKGKK